MQLAAWSSIGYALLAAHARPEAPFSGWSAVSGAIAAIGAAGGVIVALCLRYTDSVLKNFPTAASVVLVAAASAALLDGPATLPVAVGAVLVGLSILSYTDTGEG